MNLGTQTARNLQRHRKLNGTPIIIGETSYQVTSSALELTERHYLAEGLGVNADDADLRAFSMTPTDFTTQPVPGDTLTFQGITYRWLRVGPAEMIAGVAVNLRGIAYRPGLPASGTTQTTGEPNPGKRAVYSAPPINS